ncbi:N-6 DNA methylase [Desulfobacterales bacterium HSG2]|nr:N-6 DNA methylase [Desulfobacterales bacterium HSG2]
MPQITQHLFNRKRLGSVLNTVSVASLADILSRKNLIEKESESITDTLYDSDEAEQEKITTEFYNKYKRLRIHLYEHLREKNPGYDELVLLKKTQKILDRFIFVCFCEDFGLVPERIFRKMTEAVRNPAMFADVTQWDQMKNLFRAIDQGSPRHNINRFNGGLFEYDEILDGKLVMADDVFDELAEISDYDFGSDLNVNVLGHIFEQSITDIEEIRASVAGRSYDKKKGKRKKEGIYYTPEHITRYIVEQAVGGWLEERKNELGYDRLPELTEKDFRSVRYYKKTGGIRSSNRNIKDHLDFWQAYKERLSDIRVLDPACGSGAFLNQAFDYLYKEGQYVNDRIVKLRKGQTEVFRLDEHILKNNLYGADLNPESVEITKLGLWLKTADKHSELTALDENVKCGNSLIDDPLVAGKRAFKWKEEFPEIMKNGGFDVVIGNPPYVQSRAIPDAHKTFYYQNYETAEYQLNTFGLFMEKSLKLLRENSYYCLIIPNYWLSTRYDEKLRKHIFLTHHALEILNVFNVFEDATVDTLIISGIKKESSDFPRKTWVRNINPELQTISERLAAVQNQEWYFENRVSFDNENSDTKINFDKKIEIRGRYTLSDFFVFKKGMQPYEKGKGNPPQDREMMKNRVYDAKSKRDESYEPLLRARNIRRYTLLWENDWIKYGPNLAAPRTKALFEGERILVRRILSAERLEGTYLSETFINNTDIISILPRDDSIHLKSLTAIIMSKLCAGFLKKQNINLNRKAFPKINVETLRTFPVPEISEEQHVRLAQKTDIMLSENKKFQDLRNDLLDFVKSELKPHKITKKLKNWPKSDWDQFKKELAKGKVKIENLSLRERKEWHDYFRAMMGQATEIRSVIETTDRETDQMVCELYGLTEEEIKIVEK